MSLYRGAFLAEDDGEPWPVTMRERLRGRFIHAVAEVGKRLEDANRPDEAIECYLRGLDADPVIEQFYQGLMRCYTALERRSEALSAYQRLEAHAVDLARRAAFGADRAAVSALEETSRRRVISEE